MKTFTGIILAAATIAMIIYLAILGIHQEQRFTGHLKRAADANTVEIAIKEMSIALTYMEENNLTSGYTSIFYRTPDEDIEFFYTNIKASLSELVAASNSDSQLERSNVLMKLRETLIDNGGDSGDDLTVPDGLSRYPHNAIYLMINIVLMVFWFGYVVWLIYDNAF